MSFIDLSEKSKVRVMDCLGYNSQVLARLRRTSYPINACALKNKLDKIEAHSVHFFCTSSMRRGINGEERDAANATSKFQVIIHPKKAKESNGKDSRESMSYLSYYGSPPKKGDKYIEYPEIRGDANRIMKAAVKLLKEAFDLIKSVDQLSIQGESGSFEINSKFLEKLKDHKEKIKKVSVLYLVAPITLTTKELSTLFSLMNVKYVKFQGRVAALTITDELVAPLKQLTIESRDYMNRAPQVTALTDATLKLWKTNTPSTVKIVAITSFTFTAVWDFIQHAVKKRKQDKMFPTEFDFGTLRRNVEIEVIAGQLMHAQKERNYNWSPDEASRIHVFDENNNNKRFAIIYKKDTPNERCTFSFQIHF